MTDPAQHYARLQVLFTEGRAVAPERRDAFLAERCADDDALRAKLVAMLAADQDDGSDLLSETRIHAGREALERVVDDGQRGSADDADWLPERLGGYRVVRRLGAGGMGVVYEAEQDSPRRRVALKLLHPQLVTSERLRRFRHEAELLGRLQHPGIAQIHEAGTYDLGRGDQPFFAMELVDGVDLATHAERAGLGARGKLELLARVAEAVHHAHERGIVHRDLKPDNILVDAHGQPKVLDFGVARASDGTDIVSTMLTQEGVLMGTLAYMAPEQLADAAAAVTPRTDVYALGVIAYELLGGRLPHDIAGLSLPAAVRLLEREPPLPLAALAPSLRGDVDTIVSTALERDPSRRYPGADALAADIRRHLDHRPIAARPPSRVYRLRKYARRNRSLVTVLAVALLAAVVSTISAVRADRARAEADRRAAHGTLMAASLSLERGRLADDLLESIPPELRGWEWRHLRARQEPPLASIDGYPVARSLSVVDDGATVRAVSQDGIASWIDLETGRFLRQVDLGHRPLFAAQLLPGGRELVLRGGADDPSSETPYWVTMWDLESGAFTDLIPTGNHSWEGSGGELVATLEGEAVHVRDVRTGATLRSRHLGPIDLVSWASVGIVVTRQPSDVWILDPETLETRQHLQRAPDSGWAMVGYSHGDRLAVGTTSGGVEVWDLSATPPSMLRIQADTEQRWGVFSPDGAILVTSGSDAVLRTWDPSTGEPLQTFTGHTATIKDTHFVEGTRRLLSIDASGEIRSWVLGASPFVLADHGSYVYALEFAPGRELLVSGGWDGYSQLSGCLRLRDRATGAPVATLGEPSQVTTATATSIGGTLYAVLWRPIVRDVGEHSSLVALDLATGARASLVELPDTMIVDLEVLPSGERVLWSERRALTSSWVVAADAASGEIVFEHEYPLGLRGSQMSRPAPALAVSHDGAWVAVCPSVGELELRRGADLELVRRWSVYGDAVEERSQIQETGVAFSRDTERLVTLDGDVARVWSVATGEPLAVLRGHAFRLLSAVFSPDGARLVTGDFGGTLRVWDGETYELLCELNGHDDYVYALAFSPDGELLASASGDKTVRLWSTETTSQRVAAQEQRELMVEGVGPEVRRLLAELGDPAAVVERLDGRRDWSARERQVAGQVLLGEVLGTP